MHQFINHKKLFSVYCALQLPAPLSLQLKPLGHSYSTLLQDSTLLYKSPVLFFSSHRRALQTALSQRAGAAAAGAAVEGKFTFLLGIWVPFIGFRQNLAWTYYLTLETSLQKSFSFFSKSKMAPCGQKFATNCCAAILTAAKLCRWGWKLMYLSRVS